MATGKRFYWMKLKESFMTSDTIDYFMSQPDGANYVVLYQKLEDLSDAVSRETGLPKWALFCGADEFGNIIVSPRSPDAHIEQYEMEDENNGRL